MSLESSELGGGGWRWLANTKRASISCHRLRQRLEVWPRFICFVCLYRVSVCVSILLLLVKCAVCTIIFSCCLWFGAGGGIQCKDCLYTLLLAVVAPTGSNHATKWDAKRRLAPSPLYLLTMTPIGQPKKSTTATRERNTNTPTVKTATTTECDTSPKKR